MKENEEKNLKENEKKNWKDICIRIILIIIIILLLITNCSLIRKINKNDTKKPTGNIDIYEIKCDKNHCSNSDTDSSDKSSSDEKGFEILDKDIIWQKENKLKIFENPKYEMESKIAPETSNSYEFMVRNTSTGKVRYQIMFQEENPYHINMKYRLKESGIYVKGDNNNWISYNELNTVVSEINYDESNNYTLDWKWESGENDIEVSNIKEAYHLTIEVKVESIVG